MDKRKHRRSRRFLSALMVLAMLVSLLPASAFAAGEELVLSTEMNNLSITEDDLIGKDETIKISLNDESVEHKLHVRTYDAASDKYTRPSAASIEASVSDTSIAEVEIPQYQTYVNITGLKAGTTTLTVKVGDQTISVSIEVVDDLVKGAAIKVGTDYGENGSLSIMEGSYHLDAGPTDAAGQLIKGAEFVRSVTKIFTLSEQTSGIKINGANYLVTSGDGSAVIKVQVGDITGKLKLTVTEVKPTVGLRIIAQNSVELTAQEIKEALEKEGVPADSLSIENGYVVVKSVETTDDALEQYYDAYRLTYGNDRQADSIAAAVNKLFFDDDAIIDGWALNMNGSYFSWSGNITNFILSLTALPGSEIVEDEEQALELTLVNINGENKEKVIKGHYGQRISLSNYTADDKDDPITGWQYQVSDGADGWTTLSSIVNKDQIIILTEDTRLIARHDTVSHYVRIVVLEDNEETDLINLDKIDEVVEHEYIPKIIGAPQKLADGTSRDYTYKLSLTQYQALYDGSYEDNAEERAALRAFMDENSLLEVDEINFYKTSVTQYDHATAGEAITLANGDEIEEGTAMTIATFVVSFAPEPLTITPADITIYTGGNSYEGVVGDLENDPSATNSEGLPEPGYYITLPDWLNDMVNISNDSEGVETGAADLSEYKMSFTYEGIVEGETESREWPLKLYSSAENGTSY